ncbi:hypothetical protein [Sphingomicrobium flavum]|uniref:hypothetical protein n=1 Tax=Sphingomicrobium flavum TaxID=1229164 RepID=UPI0021AE1AD7|nr:hypothetical protein [Sphingomicrobium flavum]
MDQAAKFRGPVLRWKEYGSPAVLCEGEMRVTGDGPEYDALGPLPTGPVWCEIAPDARNMVFFLEPHEPPDDFGFVREGKLMLVFYLPDSLGNWRDAMARLGHEGGAVEVIGGFRALDQVRLGSGWGLPDRHLMALGESVRCELSKAATGTRVQASSVLNPRRGGPQPLPEEIRVELDVIVPPPYGHHNFIQEHEPKSVLPTDIDWRHQRLHAAMPGRVDWGQEAQRTGPLVSFGEHRETLDAPKQFRVKPAMHPMTSHLGGYTARNETDGPELVLPLNWKTIAALLEKTPYARLAMAGDGIGHLDGQSGRSVYECGGYRRQQIERVEMTLDWDGEWLRLRADGLLAPGGNDLGPELRVELDIHAHWLAAHGRVPRAKPTGDAT